jgi:hypothetical protein
MITAFVMLGGIALIAWTVFLIDWFGRRKDRQSKERRTA